MYYILKVKDKELFFNADDIMGEYICDTPMLMDEETKNSVINHIPDIIFGIDNYLEYTKDNLEVKKVELKYYD